MVQSAENLFEKLHECEITEETIKEHLESIAIKQRTRVCPVLSAMDKKNVYVPEYLIPIDEIERVVKISQTRSDDAQKSDVNEMAEDIAAQGQLTGICVILKDGSIVVAWGNHRFEAITDLATQGIPTEPGEPETKGYIWVSLFDRPTSTLPGLQSLENEIHTPAKRAKKADRIKSLRKIIESEGDIPYGKRFEDMSDTDKEQRCHGLMKEYMPKLSKSAREEIIKGYKERSTTFSSTNLSKGSLLNYWNIANDYGFNIKNKSNLGTSSAQNIKLDDGREKTAGVWLDDTGWDHGALIQQVLGARNVNKKVNWVILVASIPTSGKNAKEIVQARQDKIEEIKRWSKSVKSGKLVDEIFFVNQTADEIEKQNKSGQKWADVHRF